MNSQGTERVNEMGEVERKVDTVDYREQAGHDEPSKEGVGVVHLTRKSKDDSGILSRITAAVTNTLKSAKDAVVGKSKDDSCK